MYTYVHLLMYIHTYIYLYTQVPPWATGPALITVGAMMMRGLVEIKWGNYGEVEILWSQLAPKHTKLKNSHMHSWELWCVAL